MSILPRHYFVQASQASIEVPNMIDRLLFASRGRIGLINMDGTDERYLDFSVPNQVSWHYGPRFKDRRRILLMSVEDERTWEHNVRSHLWLYDFDDSTLVEIAQQDRPALFMPVALLMPDEKRIVTNPAIDNEQIVMTMNLDGSDQRTITRKGEGYTYGISMSPDSTRLAFHSNYQITVIRTDGTARTCIRKDPGHLYFAPVWSHDGEWLLYLDCISADDPGHEYANLCISRSDGSEHRQLTDGMSHWFATSYGNPNTRGSGSNVPCWSPVANIATYTRLLSDSRTAWQFQADRPDTDHFNRDYTPENAKGGTEICTVNANSGRTEVITSPGERVWDFRIVWSPDGLRIAFCRAEVEQPSGLWIMDADGVNQKLLTYGHEGQGADHPAWW